MKRFTLMLGFELRGILYGNPSQVSKPFVDLRRKDGVFTANAVLFPYEYEMRIGKRWFKRDIHNYVNEALLGLQKISKYCSEQKESIRVEALW